MITNLVVDCVKFGEDDSVNSVWFFGVTVVSEGLIEFHQLIYCLISDQSLPDKQDEIR